MAYTTINKSTAHFNTKLYTGDGTTSNTITGIGFQSDMAWFKARSTTDSHFLTDSVRGITKYIRPSATNAEETETTAITSLTSDGYVLSTAGNVNDNNVTYASWNWKAGTSVSGNSGGSGTAKSYTGSVNTTAGFSIIKYIGNGASGHTIPHHLGAIPQMMIIKNLTTGSTNWMIYHKTMGNTKAIYFTDASQDIDAGWWNNTSPTSSVFTLGNHANHNANNNSMIAYCFADVKGYSKMGGYKGNNLTGSNSPFIYTGFTPSFLMVKKISDTNHWIIWDNKRSTKNGKNIIDKKLYANINNAENGNDDVSFLSNGFKFNTNTGDWNATEDYLYMCFGQSIVGSNDVPATAR